MSMKSRREKGVIRRRKRKKRGGNIKRLAQKGRWQREALNTKGNALES